MTSVSDGRGFVGVQKSSGGSKLDIGGRSHLEIESVASVSESIDEVVNLAGDS
jgi:hypothetical protein